MASDNRSGNWWLIPAALLGTRFLIYGGRHGSAWLGSVVAVVVLAAMVGLLSYVGYGAVSKGLATSRAGRVAELLDSGRLADAEVALTQQLRSAPDDREGALLAELAWVRLRASRFGPAAEALAHPGLAANAALRGRRRALQALLAAARGEGASARGIVVLADSAALSPVPEELLLARVVALIAHGDHAGADARANELLAAAMGAEAAVSRHVASFALLARAYLDSVAGRPSLSTIAPRYAGEFAYLAGVPGLGPWLTRVGAARAA